MPSEHLIQDFMENHLQGFLIHSPFSNFKIHSHDILLQHEKALCSKCGRNLKFYCYQCIELAPSLKGLIPQVQLPFKISIWQHPNELSSKSTGLQIKILANNDTTLIKCHPKDFNKERVNLEKTIVLYPSSDATTLSDVELSSFDHVILIEGTWQQSKAMAQHECIKTLPKVMLQGNQETLFWRYQNVGRHCLSTIEALYYLLLEYNALTSKNLYDRKYDDLLFFFSYYYEKIQNHYKSHSNRKFTHKHKPNYIIYDKPGIE